MVALAGERQILSVDWDQRELRVVYARIRRERVQIEDVFAVTIPEDVSLADADAVGKLLRQALDQGQVSCRRVIVDIPRDQAVLNTLALPNASVSDLAGMIKVQIAKDLPFPVSEAVVDFAVPPDDGEESETRDVLVGAIRTEVLEYYRQVCHAAGLKLERVGLRPYANKVAANDFLGDAHPERLLVVDVGPRLTEIDVVRKGQLVFSRAASAYVPPDIGAAVPLGSPGESTLDDDDEAAGGLSFHTLGSEPDTGPRDLTAVVADLMVEVTRSIEAYRATDPGAEMSAVLVAGSTGIEETLADAMQRRFGVTVETYNPSRLFDGDAERGAAASGFSAALGLVLGHAGGGRLHFNFLHPKKQEVPGQARLKKVPVVAAVAVLFIAAAIVLYVQGPAKKLAKRADLEEQIRETKAEIKENKKFIALVEKAEQFEADQVVWIDELNRLVDVLPDSKHVVLAKLDMFQSGKRMELSVRAKDNRQAAKIVKELGQFRPEGRKTPYYTATRGTTSETTRGGKYPHECKISVTLPGGDSKKKSRRGGR